MSSISGIVLLSGEFREGESPALPIPVASDGAEAHPASRSSCYFLRYGGKRCILTLCFPWRLRLRHKLHLEQWKKSSLGPILQREVSGQGRSPRSRAGRPHVPAYATLLTVVLLLVTVKQVADVTVVLPKEAVTALTALLGLRGQEHPECCIQSHSPRGAWSSWSKA